MSAGIPDRPALSARVRALAGAVELVGWIVDRLYESGWSESAESLDAALTEAEELLEDVGDFEETADLENDLLSEVDESGAHERPTELPECETHDDDLDFAYGRGRYGQDLPALAADQAAGVVTSDDTF